MPVTDSIQNITDTILTDSIIKVDSAKTIISDTTDTILQVQPAFSGFNGIGIPSSPQNEPWVFGAILIMFALFVYSVARSSVWLKESVRSFFKVKDRISIFSKSTARDYESKIFLIIFSICVFSLYLYTTMNQGSEHFGFLTFTKFLGITVAFFIFKAAFIEILGYIFLNRAILKIIRDSYYNIFIYLGILIFPLLIIKIYSIEILTNYTDLAALILFGCAFILLIIKLFQIFFDNIADTFYLLLYLCTLEILPLFYILRVYKFVL